jgi:hypothetical protein
MRIRLIPHREPSTGYSSEVFTASGHSGHRCQSGLEYAALAPAWRGRSSTSAPRAQTTQL